MGGGGRGHLAGGAGGRRDVRGVWHVPALDAVHGIVHGAVNHRHRAAQLERVLPGRHGGGNAGLVPIGYHVGVCGRRRGRDRQ
jgi:hypothetical protein